MRDARELDRLESLRTYGVLGDGGPDLTGLVALAARVCATPVAAVGFLVEDRLLLRGAMGHDVTELPRAASISALVVETGEELVLSDVALALGEDHPAPTGPARAAAYAGVPLVGRDGLPIGVLAVSDHVPRAFTAEDVESLRALAQQVVTQLELYRLDRWGGRSSPVRAFGPVRLRKALDDGELVPHFQPVVDLVTGEPVAFEALLRWQHPDLGLVAPGHFLPAVEASGLMLPVGRHVLAESLGALSAMRRAGAGSQLRIAVNVAPVELGHTGFAESVLDEVALHGLDPDALAVEITETAAFVDPTIAIRELAELRGAGVQVALDDYGAGHSSVLRMLRLPLTTLKLDRELTGDVTTDARARAVTRSTVAMAAELGLVVIAEGVEHKDQGEALREMGCEQGQGWHFGRPVPATSLLEWLPPAELPAQRTAPQTVRTTRGAESAACRQAVVSSTSSI